jgi:hypothetical protein
MSVDAESLIIDAIMPAFDVSIAELGESPGRELAFGAVGKFWQPNIKWRDVAADEFASFSEPGWARSSRTSRCSPTATAPRC